MLPAPEAEHNGMAAGRVDRCGRTVKLKPAVMAVVVGDAGHVYIELIKILYEGGERGQGGGVWVRFKIGLRSP